MTREELLMTVLAGHSEEQPIGMAELFEAVFGATPENRINDTWRLRQLLRRLRRAGKHICSSKKGYWLGLTPAEIEATARKLESRGLSSLGQAARLRRIGLPELLGQMQLQVSGDRGQGAGE
jgi:hypothetical protein